jgi:hypothetical protein
MVFVTLNGKERPQEIWNRIESELTQSAQLRIILHADGEVYFRQSVSDPIARTPVQNQ